MESSLDEEDEGPNFTDKFFILIMPGFEYDESLKKYVQIHNDDIEFE